VHLVLDEEVDQWYKCAKEGISQAFAVLDRSRIRRAEHRTSNGPGQRSHQIADHKDVVPIVVIRARDVRPSTTSKRPEDTDSCDKLRQSATRAVCKAVEEEYQHEAGARTYCDENLEDRSFWVSVSNGGADRGKPFLRITPMLVLYDLVVVK
jgi:hypothetical protein